MTHVNFLLHSILVSETQTDRQTRLNILMKQKPCHVNIVLHVLYVLFIITLNTYLCTYQNNCHFCAYAKRFNKYFL